VSPSQRVTLRLDLDLASEPIEGEVWEPLGRVHPFVGWLGLAGALERAVHGGVDPHTPSQEEPDVT
jgi:hypothetical protein